MTRSRHRWKCPAFQQTMYSRLTGCLCSTLGLRERMQLLCSGMHMRPTFGSKACA